MKPDPLWAVFGCLADSARFPGLVPRAAGRVAPRRLGKGALPGWLDRVTKGVAVTKPTKDGPSKMVLLDLHGLFWSFNVKARARFFRDSLHDGLPIAILS